MTEQIRTKPPLYDRPMTVKLLVSLPDHQYRWLKSQSSPMAEVIRELIADAMKESDDV